LDPTPSSVEVGYLVPSQSYASVRADSGVNAVLTVKTIVLPVKGKGLGLFADEVIKPGQTWWVANVHFDRVFSPGEVERLDPVSKAFLAKYATLEPDGTTYLSADDARFTNHADSPNSHATKNPATGAVLSMAAAVLIEPGQEITCDYREICCTCEKDLGFVPG
jgi:hypothetical protein